MMRRVLRLLTVGALGRAWAQKSPKWVSIAGALVLFRFFDSRSKKAAKRSKLNDA